MFGLSLPGRLASLLPSLSATVFLAQGLALNLLSGTVAQAVPQVAPQLATPIVIEDVVLCGFSDLQVSVKKRCVPQPHQITFKGDVISDSFKPIWLAECQKIMRGEVLSSVPCPNGYSSTRPSFLRLCEREERIPIFRDDGEVFDDRGECERFLEGVDCKARFEGFEYVHNLLVSHTWVSHYSCINDDIEIGQGGEQQGEQQQGEQASLPSNKPNLPSENGQEELPNGEPPAQAISSLKCTKTGFFTHGGRPRCVRDSGLDERPWRFNCFYWCEERGEVSKACPDDSYTQMDFFCGALLAQFPEQKPHDTSFSSADDRVSLQWPAKISADFKTVDECLTELNKYKIKDLCEDLNKADSLPIRQAVCAPMTVSIDQQCVNPAEGDNDRPSMPGLGEPEAQVAKPLLPAIAPEPDNRELELF